jgi:hypothetical protein
MAEEKKAPPSLEPWEFLLILLIIIAIAGIISLKVAGLIRSISNQPIGGELYFGFLNFIYNFKVFSFVISVLFLLGIIYSIIKINEISKAQRDLLTPPEAEAKKEPGNIKWNRVLEHISSPNPSDWKLAILEADIMLDDMVEKMGYSGETLGDRLKKIEKSDFTTIDSAWEAHKIRNSIAHEGSDFLITQREAQRVVSLYKEVFEEFKYI